jgi:hypothetical protein
LLQFTERHIIVILHREENMISQGTLELLSIISNVQNVDNEDNDIENRQFEIFVSKTKNWRFKILSLLRLLLNLT